MPVVSNTSPVLNLAVIGRLYLLHDQFGEILIPNAVLEELRIQEDLPGSPATREALKEGRLPSMQKAMDQLRDLAGFRIGAELYDDLVRKSGESK